MDCFAMNENGKCTVLSEEICEGITCGFHKTKKEQEESSEKSKCKITQPAEMSAGGYR